MSETYIGAIDQGTTSSRFIVFDRAGDIVSVAQQEHEQIYPQPGWVEHDAAEIWRNTEAMIAKALQQKGLKPSDLAAVGITNQRETTVVWDRKTGQPVCNALVWQDTRVDSLARDYARDGGADRFRATTGLPLASYFSGLKLQWVLDNTPGLRARAEAGEIAFGTIDSWMVWNLTGGAEHLTDVTNASRTQLMNLETLDWDEGMLAAFKIPRAVLPRIVPSSQVYAEATGVLAGTKIAGILGDQQAALVGQVCFAPGEAKITYGTGCFMLMHTGTEAVQSTAGLLTTVAYQFGDAAPCYALEGSVAISGALIQWLRDNLGLIKTSPEIEDLAKTVDDNGDVYIVPAFSGLYAPYWRDDARGIIAGLTRYARAGHFARAALEAVAYQTRDVVEAMEKDSGIALKELRADGGMVGNQLLMQFQADILNLPVVRPEVAETTALGAAYAAGLAVGVWKDPKDLAANWKASQRWEPQMSEDKRAGLYKSWKKAVGRSFDWVV
ncbi:MAG: glycerol kinase [Caulobacterales bacterium 68-7]|nr:glycerol kinase GlpK [Caulobacterales bacterium]OJU13819.1 MAG: glycerol kinase [Caulobacterales bacterium 68-7]